MNNTTKLYAVVEVYWEDLDDSRYVIGIFTDVEKAKEKATDYYHENVRSIGPRITEYELKVVEFNANTLYDGAITDGTFIWKISSEEA